MSRSTRQSHFGESRHARRMLFLELLRLERGSFLRFDDAGAHLLAIGVGFCGDGRFGFFELSLSHFGVWERCCGETRRCCCCRYGSCWWTDRSYECQGPSQLPLLRSSSVVETTTTTPFAKMVKALSFKGDKKPPKKRKRAEKEEEGDIAPSSKQLIPTTTTTTQQAEPEDDENWVSADSVKDIAGPIILVLPSDPVACIAVDQLGRVFTSKIENMVENEPHSAEPHHVRQVWISQKIVGTENTFTFKGHHGNYLGCDQFGILSSTREAVSPEETFKVNAIESQPGHFAIQTAMRSTFLSVDEDKDPADVRGDAEEATCIRIRMQARFKPKHKTEKAEKVRAKISRKELEAEVGRRLEDDEVRKLKKARREGNYHEVMLDVKVKGKHDKFA